jgi:hypothetical protein
MQNYLFNQKENHQGTSQPIQIKKGGIPLSKEQQAFNRLSKRIEKLQKQIQDETKRLEDLNNLYNKEVSPNIFELGRLKIELCHLLDQKRVDIKLSNAQRQKLDTILLDFLDDAFTVIEPNEATKKLYEKYSGLNYEEELSRQESSMGEEFSTMLYEQFGIQLDPSVFTSQPDFEKIEAELKQQWESQNIHKKPRKKSQKQLEKEEQKKQKESLKSKSVRSIYIALAKMLHPDTEQNELLKKEKEEMMKQVVAAYESKNLMLLLKLEMQWIKGHNDSFNNMGMETLNLYVELLKDQVKELEEELHMLNINPIYSNIEEFCDIDKNTALWAIRNQGESYKEVNKEIHSIIDLLEQGTKIKATVTQFIQEYYIDPKENFFWDL